MQKKPLVSIALCTYNGAEYLSQQVETLVNQTYDNIEIIAVDDCSTDRTFNILEEYASQYLHFKLFKNPDNIGYTANFEKAALLCNGELIAFCDQDDIWHEDKIMLQVNALKDNLLIYHDSEFVYQNGSPMNKKISDVVNLYRGEQPEAFLFFNCVSGHSILIRKELLNIALPLKEGYFHDWWLAYVATNVGKIDYIPQCLVKYRQHGTSETNILGLTRKTNNYNYSSLVRIDRQYKWLEHCAAFNNNRHPLLIMRFFNAYARRLKNYLSFELAYLVLVHFNKIFFIRKKPFASKLNFAIQQIYGKRAKRLLK